MKSRNTSFSNVLLLLLHSHRSRKAPRFVLQHGVLRHVRQVLCWWHRPPSLGPLRWPRGHAEAVLCLRREPYAGQLGAVRATQQERLRADCCGLCLVKIWLSVWKLHLRTPSWNSVPAPSHSHKTQWWCVLLLCPVAGASAVLPVSAWDLNP